MNLSLTKPLLLSLLLIAANLLSAQNALKNPGFETPASGWNYWGGVQSPEAQSGAFSLKVTNDKPQWSGADQIIVLPEDAYVIEVEGYIKTEGVVKGAQPWEVARIAVEFLDEGGELTGGYPPVTGQAQGTRDWTKYNQHYRVPAGAAKVKLQCALGNATGTAYFDAISLVIRDKTGAALEPRAITGPLSYGEWYDMPVSKNKTAHYVDWSSLLHTPAGKHGFLQAKDGKFVFEDGTPAKFWGVNLVATSCFPDKAGADSVAARLAKMGCNLVRLHHMDAPWSNPNIFGNTGSTRSLSKESMQKLDYLIYALKKKGIYIFMDLLVHRKFYPEDGVYNEPPDNGAKQVGAFSRKLIELQKEFAEQVFHHVNKYTKTAYKDEPAIIASEFINEATIFTAFEGDVLTDPYRKELQDMWEAEGNTGELPRFRINYGLTGGGLEIQQQGTADVEKSIRFLANKEAAYYDEMHEALRSIGVKIPLSGTNMPVSILANIRNNARLDFTIVNGYWDHPQLWKIGGDWSRVLYAPVDNRSQIRGYTASLINTLSRFKVHNKPFVVTEWNHCYPNEYRLEGVPLLAAYASLQGWDGLTQFDFGLEPLYGSRITAFSTNVIPEHIAQWVIAAPLFHKGYVREAMEEAVVYVPEAQATDLPSYSDFLTKHPHLPYRKRVSLTFDEQEATTVATGNPDKEKGVIAAETDELLLDYQQGFMKIETDRVQGVCGAISEAGIRLPLFEVRAKNPYISVMAVSADDKPLVTSEHFYLVVVTPTRMSGQAFNDTRTALENTGKLPVQVQVAEGEVVFRPKAKKYTVYSLTPSGQRAGLTVLKKGDFKLDLSKGRTFVYEVKVTSKQ